MLQARLAAPDFDWKGKWSALVKANWLLILLLVDVVARQMNESLLYILSHLSVFCVYGCCSRLSRCEAKREVLFTTNLKLYSIALIEVD